jgi:hypothetical protein
LEALKITANLFYHRQKMADAKNKTQPTDVSVEGFLSAVGDENQRADSYKLVDIMRRATGEEPRMWGPAIIGFGLRHLKYESGREMDWMLAGFSPRKGNLSLYITGGFPKYDELVAKLGKHKSGKSCLYVRKLSDIDEAVLAELVKESVAHHRNAK